MIRLITIATLFCWAFGIDSAASPEIASGITNPTPIEIRSVTVGGKPLSWHPGEPLRLPPFPVNIAFTYGTVSNSSRVPLRLRYKLEGYDHTWRENCGQMFLAVRFLDESGEQVARTIWNVSGESPGWNGELTTATLNHRREMLEVPPGASRLQVSISSGGPAGTVGIYVVDDLVVSRFASNSGPATVLLRSPVGRTLGEETINQAPSVWFHLGTRPSMAKTVEIGRTPSTKALAILDEDPFGHADWDSPKRRAPQVTPGDQLLLEWNEVYSMGIANESVAWYPKLPQGNYRFCVAELTALGVPAGAETALIVSVPLPFWKTPWFWGTVATLMVAASAAAGRYLTRRRMRNRMSRLRQERVLEQERLRIAQNIHDDLGARITQISLLSGMSQNDPQLPEKARAAFDTISRMSRDLVSALYETVWTVNPENDHLEALGSYLGQMANQLCHQGPVRCRIHIDDLPPDVQVSSHTRHHLTLAVKEAVHNIIKHAHASEAALRVAWTDESLTVSIQDNGRGFSVNSAPVGNGLANMKRRLAELGGTCAVQSQPGQGTTVELRLKVSSQNREHSSHSPVLAGRGD